MACLSKRAALHVFYNNSLFFLQVCICTQCHAASQIWSLQDTNTPRHATYQSKLVLSLCFFRRSLVVRVAMLHPQRKVDLRQILPFHALTWQLVLSSTLAKSQALCKLKKQAMSIYLRDSEAARQDFHSVASLIIAQQWGSAYKGETCKIIHGHMWKTSTA